MSMYPEANLEAQYEEAYTEVTPNGSEERVIAGLYPDMSGSMSAYKNDVCKGIKRFKNDLIKNDNTRGIVDLYLVPFGFQELNNDPSTAVKVIGPKPVGEFTDPEIDHLMENCGYGTPGETALQKGRVVRKTHLKKLIASNLGFKIPLEVWMTDLCFNTFDQGHYDRHVNDCKEEKTNLFIVVPPDDSNGNPTFNVEKARELENAGAQILRLNEQNEKGYSDLFNFVTASVKIVSVSVKGETVNAPDPAKYGLTPITLKLKV